MPRGILMQALHIMGVLHFQSFHGVNPRGFFVPLNRHSWWIVLVLLHRRSFAKPANDPGLHDLGQDHIAHQHNRQEQPVRRR